MWCTAPKRCARLCPQGASILTGRRRLTSMCRTLTHDQTSSKFYINKPTILTLSLPIKQTSVRKHGSCKSPVSLRAGHHVAGGGRRQRLWELSVWGNRNRVRDDWRQKNKWGLGREPCPAECEWALEAEALVSKLRQDREAIVWRSEGESWLWAALVPFFTCLDF